MGKKKKSIFKTYTEESAKEIGEKIKNKTLENPKLPKKKPTNDKFVDKASVCSVGVSTDSNDRDNAEYEKPRKEDIKSVTVNTQHEYIEHPAIPQSQNSKVHFEGLLAKQSFSQPAIRTKLDAKRYQDIEGWTAANGQEVVNKDSSNSSWENEFEDPNPTFSESHNQKMNNESKSSYEQNNINNFELEKDKNSVTENFNDSFGQKPLTTTPVSTKSQVNTAIPVVNTDGNVKKPAWAAKFGPPQTTQKPFGNQPQIVKKEKRNPDRSMYQCAPSIPGRSHVNVNSSLNPMAAEFNLHSGSSPHGHHTDPNICSSPERSNWSSEWDDTTNELVSTPEMPVLSNVDVSAEGSKSAGAAPFKTVTETQENWYSDKSERNFRPDNRNSTDSWCTQRSKKTPNSTYRGPYGGNSRDDNYRRHQNREIKLKSFYNDRQTPSSSLLSQNVDISCNNDYGKTDETRSTRETTQGNKDNAFYWNQEVEACPKESSENYRNYQETPSKSRKSSDFEKKVDPRMIREKFNDSRNSYIEKSPKTTENWRQSRGTPEKSEQEFVLFEKTWKMVQDFKVVKEIEGDLFKQPKDYSLAHCVAEDLRMGSGIAVDFKREFKNLPDLLDQRAKQGGLAHLHDDENNRYVYYLVTKRESTGKPTYLTMWKSLTKMRDHIKENKVGKLAIPRLGCGLDRLEWNKVKRMIEHLFDGVEIEITVCNFQQQIEDTGSGQFTPKKSTNTCKFVIESYPITKIAQGTFILYFSTEAGDVTQEMAELNKKFNFCTNFTSVKPKKLGDIVLHEDRAKNYVLCGCIVRKTLKDNIEFKSLAKCALEINKVNKKYGDAAFSYVAFQWVNETEYFDDSVNQKIVTLLMNILKKVELYVCQGNFEEE